MGMSTNDLMESIDEGRDERVAIMVESAVIDPVERAEEDRHRCEVRAVVRQCYPHGDKAAEYLDLVESKRGKDAASRLRKDVREAWRERMKEGKR
jgi:hypothetical protein